MTFADSKQRFSSRVADYVRYRPGYPAPLVDLLRRECGLSPRHLIADVGSGTGLLSKVFLDYGNRVIGVEPNADMRAAGDEFLSGYPAFSSVPGSAEATTLAAGSVDFVTAGQSFHWFEPAAAWAEFAHILGPGGWVVVVWNDRHVDGTAFGRAYEALLECYGSDYTLVKDAYPDAQDLERFFGPGCFERRELENYQEFDFAGLQGRLCSSSYAPREGHPNYRPMMDALAELFSATEKSGRVRMDYATQICFGRLVPAKGAR